MAASLIDVCYEQTSTNKCRCVTNIQEMDQAKREIELLNKLHYK